MFLLELFSHPQFLEHHQNFSFWINEICIQEGEPSNFKHIGPWRLLVPGWTPFRANGGQHPVKWAHWSLNRSTTGADGFLILSQALLGPDR